MIKTSERAKVYKGPVSYFFNRKGTIEVEKVVAVELGSIPDEEGLSTYRAALDLKLALDYHFYLLHVDKEGTNGFRRLLLHRGMNEQGVMQSLEADEAREIATKINQHLAQMREKKRTTA